MDTNIFLIVQACSLLLRYKDVPMTNVYSESSVYQYKLLAESCERSLSVSSSVSCSMFGLVPPDIFSWLLVGRERVVLVGELIKAPMGLKLYEIFAVMCQNLSIRLSL